MRHVWLVLDADRHPFDVCDSEETARGLAHAQGGTVEQWPLTVSDERRAWSESMRRLIAGTPVTREAARRAGEQGVQE